ncbi:hypothetical protein AVEN_87104-1 [Araneus ventricosus]|uniref:Uncharacterized protein n=1 Tax=Araneus ventricosus TaxID=182803 RepID=A0A4Y2TF42_ARAVE|nr:hypothetical protein AVEN_87104-1 [Araneus ventricosus]
MRLARDYRQSKLLVQGVQVVSKVITGVKLPFETSHSSTFTTSLSPDLAPCDFSSDEEPAYETTALKFRRSRGIDKNEACNQFLHLCMSDGKNHSCTEFSLRRKYQVNRFLSVLLFHNKTDDQPDLARYCHETKWNRESSCSQKCGLKEEIVTREYVDEKTPDK